MTHVSAAVSVQQLPEPTDAELSATWAHSILAGLPCAGEGCETVDQQLAAAAVHAQLAIAARIGELVKALADSNLRQIPIELEGIRCDGIAVVQG